MNIIIDTNVIISSLCFPSSKPRQAFDLARKIGSLVFSNDTLSELTDVLNRKKFDTYIDINLRVQFINELQSVSKIFNVTEKLEVSRDTKDNIFLELALSADSKYIITGDNDLLVLNPYAGIQIINPSDFLNTFL